MSAGGIMGCVVNERLRRAMLRAGYSVETLADAAGVVSKSVQRWITGGGDAVCPDQVPGGRSAAGR
jgi:hypothetical protein